MPDVTPIRVVTDFRKPLLLASTLAGIIAGGAARISGAADIADTLWAITTGLALIPLVVTVGRELMRGDVGVDVIALIAMAGALVLGEYLAGAVIALMLTGGQTLEEAADGRARRELSALLERAPKQVLRHENGHLAPRPVEDVVPGDVLLVKPGEVVPVDGVLTSVAAVLDESALTGEALPVEHLQGDLLLSGAVNAGGPFDLRASATAAESTYAGVVRLVEEAQASKAPFVRLADRYALYFLPLTILIAGIAWVISGDPVRALAVFVVATPCPLILAAPVAIVSGISRAARRGVIVKGGGALETLGRARTLMLDKTGTITTGSPLVSSVVAFSGDEDAVLRWAASLDQVSSHVLAGAIVRAARGRRLSLGFPSAVHEEAGKGLAGTVEGRSVAVGQAPFVGRGSPLPPDVRRLQRRTSLQGSSNVYVSLDGRIIGAIVLEDPVRSDTPRTLRRLRRSGITRILMVTGDQANVAESVAAAIGVDGVLSERSPADKVDAVRAAATECVTVMVGDGINDAPALAAADVGVAMGARGATASSEAADIVLLVDRLDRLADAMLTARRSRQIALQSVIAGMALSIGAMGFAAVGLLVPVAGALLQEAIDVAVILNALRALRDEPVRRPRPVDQAGAEASLRMREEHRSLLPEVERIRAVADRLDELPVAEAMEALGGLRRFLVEELAPHEEVEDATVYPLVARLIGGDDPTATMTRAHLEIDHQIRLLSGMLEGLDPSGPGPEDLRDLRRVLYGLHAVLRLHFAQEEETYLALIEERLGTGDDSFIR